MGQPTFTPFKTGDTCNHTSMNSAFSSIVTQSSSVGTVNIRDEGFDRKSFATGAVSTLYLSTKNENTQAYSYGTAGGPNYDISAWLPVQTPVVTLRISGTPTFTIDVTKQIAKVRVSLEIRRFQGVAAPPYYSVAFQMFYRLSGGADTAIARTYRGLCTAENTNYAKTNLTISTMLTVSGTYDYIDLRVINTGAALDAAGKWLYLSEAFMDLEVKEH